MAVDAVTNTAADAAGATGARTRLSDNYDTFLVLLTAQLQNQDPLAPMDSTQFTQQLVQFSQVEQQIRTNEQLEGLVTQYQSASAGAALSYLGRDAILEDDSTRLTDGKANWAYALEDTADEVTLTVRDARGRDVFKAAGAKTEGDHLFAWDGRDSNGDPVEDGVYTLVISAEDAAGEAIEHTTTVRETILGVDFTSSTPVVITSSGTHGIDTVRAVLDQG
jgi:flagellar basal-body rod modification protein FlgD